MKSKASMSFNPIVGFVKAQIHNFLFSALIFTIITVGISFACGSNSLYGYDVENISYNDPRSVGFAVVIMLAAFIFAAFSFKPFLAKEKLVLMKNEAILTCFAPIPGRSLFLLYN